MQKILSENINPTLKKISSKGLDFKKMNGLIPVIAQEMNSGIVLMLAYTNTSAFEKTVKTGYAHYWSRSRKTIWKKGEISGNSQKIIEILVDCDKDALIYKVQQKGPACHTGKPNCFFTKLL
tara:strand:+ start:805 stop:1170 length:366 start_codon:yes stop_codon:yes gene_type:complete